MKIAETADDAVGDVKDGDTVMIERWREILPNGVAHMTLNLVEGGLLDDTPVYTVPQGHYFMMGDNRDDSTDSRVLSEVGYIPLANFIGRAEVLFFSVGSGAAAWQFWRWPWTVRWRRLFSAVR